MHKLGLDRQILATITKNHQAMVALERVFRDVGGTLPDSIEQAVAAAAQAIATANAAFASLADIAGELERVMQEPAGHPTAEPEQISAPAAPLEIDADNFAPAAQVGSLAAQNHDAVEITGGTAGLDAGTAAKPSLYFGSGSNTGMYQIAVNILGVAVNGSKVLDISTSGLDISGNATVNGTYVQTGKANVGSGGQFRSLDDTGTLRWISGLLGTAAAINYTIYDVVAGSPRMSIDGVSGGVSFSNGFGCNGVPPQLKATLGSAATDLATVITLANNLRAALIANGIGTT